MKVLITYNDLGQDMVEIDVEYFSDAIIQAVKETACAAVISAQVVEP